MYVHQHSQLRLYAPLYKIKEIRICQLHLHCPFDCNIQHNLWYWFFFSKYSSKLQLQDNTLCCKFIVCTALSYLCDCLQLDTPSPTPHPASENLRLQIACTRLSTVCSPIFSHHDLQWNNHPLPVWKKPSLDSFKSNLKTFLIPKQIDPPRFLLSNYLPPSVH